MKLQISFLLGLILCFTVTSVARAQQPGTAAAPTPYGYGAAGDGVTDDTAALTVWLKAIPAGGLGYLPCGSYRVIGSGSEIFLISNKRINIVGSGQCASIKVDSSVPNSRDVFRFAISSDIYDQWYFRNFQITGGHGRYGMYFDATADTTTRFRDLVIEGVAINTDASVGRALYFQGNPGSPDGALVHGTIRDSLLWQGLECRYCGDTVEIANNLIPADGGGGAVYVSIKPGSGIAGLRLVHNNISVQGMVQLVDTTACVLRDNEIEQQWPNSEANHAMLDIGGADCLIDGGNVSSQTNITHNPVPIRVDAANVRIDGVRLQVGERYNHITVTSNGNNTVIGPKVACYGYGAPPCVIGDSGTNSLIQSEWPASRRRHPTIRPLNRPRSGST